MPLLQSPGNRNGLPRHAQAIGGRENLLNEQEAHMVAHIIPTLLGIVAPLSTIGWLLSRGV
jgi:hypothetical protein